MNKPVYQDLFICASTRDEAHAVARAIVEGKIALGARHQSREAAEEWCKKVNDARVYGGHHDTVWPLNVMWHWGPDGRIFDYRQIVA